MRFGIYCEMQTPPDKSHYDQTWEIMRQIEHADESGFDVYSVIDHHFFQKFSISTNPLAMFAAAAQRTNRIRFRTALHTLPLENPMRLAGMIAETDILTNGRLEFRGCHVTALPQVLMEEARHCIATLGGIKNRPRRRDRNGGSQRVLRGCGLQRGGRCLRHGRGSCRIATNRNGE